MEDAVAKGADPFRALADHAAEAIVTIDEGDRIVYANPAAARLFGYPLEELVALPFTALIPERFRRHHRAGVERYTRTGERRLDWTGVELVGLRADGTEVPLEITFGEYASPEGRRFTGIMRDVSERRAAEHALLETTETLQAIVHGAPLAIVGISHAGLVSLWSPAAERLFGWSEREVLGRPLPILPAGLEAESERLREDTLKGAVVAGHETERLRRDGSSLPVRLSVAPLRGSDGSITGTVAMYEDVTAARAVESARALGESRLRFLVEAGQALAASLDPEATLREVARLAVPRIADWCVIHLKEGDAIRLVEVAHRDPGRVAAARAIGELHPPRPDAPAGVAAVIRTGEPELTPEVTPEMLRAAARDEEHGRRLAELDLRSMLTVPLHARGLTIGAITLVLGGSGRRFGPDDLVFASELGARAGLALDNARLYARAARQAEEEAALRRAAEAVAASVTIDEVIGTIAESARVAIAADGAFVEHITDAVDEVEVIAVRGEVTPALGKRGGYRGSFAEEVVRTGAPRLVRDLAAEASPASGVLAGSCEGCAALVLPLTDGVDPVGALVLVRRLERGVFTDHEIRRAATFANLAALVYRRVHLVQETQRRREELEAVTESRARLLRGFSHDVKNPLGAADGHLELLQEGILDPLAPKQLESVRRSRAAIKAALELIDDLVELARAEATRVSIESGPTDLAALVRDVAEEHRPAAELKGLEVKVELPNDTPIIESDPSRARQILGNLVSNAIKYTDDGEVRLRVEVPVPDADGRRCIAARVTDSGRGIPEDKHHVLFQEFGRVAQDVKGSGLGLAISRRLARALGGDITVESRPGEGSTFSLWLPLERDRSGGVERVA